MTIAIPFRIASAFSSRPKPLPSQPAKPDAYFRTADRRVLMPAVWHDHRSATRTARGQPLQFVR